MANYGRGWAEGYGHQSAEAMDAQHDRDMAEAEQIAYRARLDREKREAKARSVPDHGTLEAAAAKVVETWDFGLWRHHGTNAQEQEWHRAIRDLREALRARVPDHGTPEPH